jgi:GTPase
LSRKSKTDIKAAKAAKVAAPVVEPERTEGVYATHHLEGRSIGTRALVLVPQPPRGKRFDSTSRKASDTSPEPPPLHSAEDRLAEASGLAEAIDLDVVQSLIVPLAAPRPATLFGRGKVEEIKALIDEQEITLAIVDHLLSPIQQRNLEKAWNAKVLDRTGLILEIFGRRAQTREGRLQVELAHLTYQKSRLVRAWTHLERQRGGAGFLGGPGESQLELDRRMIQDRIDALKKELLQVVRTREINRATRKKVPYKVVAIVGYTNAGKSTLFNRVTGAAVLAKDQVFATLDPTMREVKVAPGRKIILSDTVGFISDLPTMLVAAFRATLEEVIEAALVLHVRDISHTETEAQAADVRSVLRDLGINADDADTRILEVWNKVDRLTEEQRAALDLDVARLEQKPVLVSAITGEGVEQLFATINTLLGADDDRLALSVAPAQGKLVHWLHEHTEIISRRDADDGQMHFVLRVAPDKRGRLDHQVKTAGARLQKLE